MPNRRAIRDGTFYAEWAIRHTFCQGCGVPQLSAPYAPGCGGVGLTTHHIIKRGRSDEGCNLLRLCRRCHDLAEGLLIRVDGALLPRLTVGVCLRIKHEREPAEYDAVRLRYLRGMNLPDLEPIPTVLVESWGRWRGSVVPSAPAVPGGLPPGGIAF